MTYVPQTVKDLYHLLENDFHPLDLAHKVQPLLGKLSELSDKFSSASPVPEVQLEQYIPGLERLTTLRVLQQVSQVYQTMKITALSRMIPFCDFAAVEKLGVDAVKCNFLQLKIEHLKGIVQFGSQDHLESDKIQNHLTILAKRLIKARSLIHEFIPCVEKFAKASPQHLLQDIEKEHSKLLARKLLIDRHNEEHERKMLEMEREEDSKKLKQQRIIEEAEQKRLASEYQNIKEERVRREIEEKESEEANSLLQQQVERIRKGKKAKIPAIEGEKVTKQMLMEHAMQELLHKMQEMERKFQKLEKTRDYLERAKREEEAPLIEAAYQKHLVDDEIFFQQ